MIRRNLILGFIALMALVACDTNITQPTLSDDVISFGTATTRASALVGGADSQEFRNEPFAVYGDWIYNSNGDRKEEFGDVAVRYESGADTPTGWIYDDLKRWQPSGEYDFRAYWPASSTVLGTATTRTLALEYNMLQQNNDLMVAYRHCATRNNGNPVELNFYHTLAAVCVKFYSSNSECEYRVKNVFFTSLNYIGALPYDSTNEQPDVTYDWVYNEGSRSYVHPTDIMLSERLREWSSSEGVLIPATIDDYPEHFDLFLPQSLRVASDVALPSITFTIDVRWGTTDTLTITLPLPDTDTNGNEMVWMAGKKYIYTIGVKPDSFDVEVTTSEWDKVTGTTEDIIF